MQVHARVCDDSGIMGRMVMRALTETKSAGMVYDEGVDVEDGLPQPILEKIAEARKLQGFFAELGASIG